MIDHRYKSLYDLIKHAGDLYSQVHSCSSEDIEKNKHIIDLLNRSLISEDKSKIILYSSSFILNSKCIPNYIGKLIVDLLHDKLKTKNKKRKYSKIYLKSRNRLIHYIYNAIMNKNFKFLWALFFELTEYDDDDMELFFKSEPDLKSMYEILFLIDTINCCRRYILKIDKLRYCIDKIRKNNSRKVKSVDARIFVAEMFDLNYNSVKSYIYNDNINEVLIYKDNDRYIIPSFDDEIIDEYVDYIDLYLDKYKNCDGLFCCKKIYKIKCSF